MCNHHAAVLHLKGFAPLVLQNGQRYVNPNSNKAIAIIPFQYYSVSLCGGFFLSQNMYFVGSEVRGHLQKVIFRLSGETTSLKCHH